MIFVAQMTKSVNNVQELGMLANSLTRDYCALAGDSRGAVASCANPQVRNSTFNVLFESFSYLHDFLLGKRLDILLGLRIRNL